MQRQRDLGRAGRQENESMKVQGGPLADLEVKSEFVGYTDLLTEAKVVAIVAGDALVDVCGRRTDVSGYPGQDSVLRGKWRTSQ